MTRLLRRVGSVVLVERREPSGVTWGVYDEAVEPERVDHVGLGIGGLPYQPAALP